MADKQVKYEVTAENAGYVKAMEEIAAASLVAEASIKAAFGGVGEAFGAAMSHIGALAALLGGGAVFSKGVDATKELTGEAVKLSKALGVPIERASELNVALRSIGSSADVYTDANAKLTRQIRTNEAAVNAMGVATRGSNGQLLNGELIMRNALTGLARYKEGTDRNLAGQQLFGKGAAEVTGLLKLLGVNMDEISRKAKDLGLQIGPEQAARVKEYKEAMEGVSLVTEALENAIGQALLPVLTESATWFESIGPQAVQAMRTAVDVAVLAIKGLIEVITTLGKIGGEIFTTLGTVVEQVTGVEIPKGMGVWDTVMRGIGIGVLSLKVVVVAAFELIGLAVDYLIIRIGALGMAFKELLTGGFSAAGAALDAGAAAFEARAKKVMERMRAQKEEDQAAFKQLFGVGGPAPSSSRATTGPSSKGDRNYVDPNAAGDSEALKAQFAVIRAQLEGQLALQKEYLAEAMQAYDDAYKHNRITVQEFYAAKLAIEQQDLRSAVEIKQEELRQTQALEAKAVKPADKLGLKAKEIQITSQLAVLNAQLANTEIKNARELNDELLKRSNRMLDIQRLSREQAAISGVEMDRVALDQRHALKQTSDAEYLQQEKQLQDRLYQIKLKALQDSIALQDGDVAKIAEINKQIEGLELQHAVEMARIDKDIVLEAAQNTLDAQKQIEDATTNFLSSLGDRTKSVKDKFRDLVKSIEASFEELVAKNFTKQLFAGLTSSIGGGGGGAGWLGGLLGNIPSFDVGTPYVSQDMLAVVHKGERITPAAQNSPDYGGGVNVVNNFHFQGNVDTRTQSQVASAAGRSIRLAMSRNA